jgi:hypothetical protein
VSVLIHDEDSVRRALHFRGEKNVGEAKVALQLLKVAVSGMFHAAAPGRERAHV